MLFLFDCKMYSRFIHFRLRLSGRPLESLSLSRKRVSDDSAKQWVQGGSQNNSWLIGPSVVCTRPFWVCNPAVIKLVFILLSPASSGYGAHPSPQRQSLWTRVKEEGFVGMGTVRGYCL